MADVKWIKIVTDIFDNKKIKMLEAMPEGDSIIVIWLKLLILAGNTNDNGYIYFTKDIPFTDQMLATLFNRPLITVQLALNTFQNYGMIEIVDDILRVSNWEKYQNVEGMERVRELTKKRVAKHRELKRLEMESQSCSYCGEPATGYDHIVAISRGGDDEDYNKTPCCMRCNRIKNDKPLVDFLNSNRNLIKDDLIANNPKLKRYVTLCNVTGRYKVTQSNAIDIDIDKEKDINTPLPPLGETNQQSYDFNKHTNLENAKHVLNQKIFGEWEYIKDHPELWEIIKAWMEYKDAKKPKASNRYVNQRSMCTLLGKMVNNSKKYGTKSVCSVIDDSMGEGYTGIVWDWLDKKNNNVSTDWGNIH